MKTLIRVVLSLLILALQPLSLAQAQEQLELPLEDQMTFPFMAAPSEGLELTPPAASGIKKISVRAIDGTAGRIEDVASRVEKSGAITSITEVVPDESDAVPGAFYSRATGLTRRLGAKSHQTIKVSAKQFGEWFVKNRLRFTIIAFEITVMSGLKFTELMLSPVPISYASAFTASLVLGGVLGGLEWNMARVVMFLRTPGALVSNLILRITGGADASARNLKTRVALEKALQVVKSTGVNFALFGVFKILLFATTQTDGSMMSGLFEAFTTISGGDVAKWATMGFESTVVSFPTSELIIKKFQKEMAEAGTDPKKIERAKLRFQLFMSSALTARAVLFSSVIIAGALHWPLLAVTAYSGLGLMFTGSVAKLYSDAKTAKRAAKCAAIFAGA